jgi:large subunit ribosomal protein L4
MSKVKLYSLKLKKTSSFTLAKEFTGDINESLLAQALHVYRDRTHAGNSKVKTRSEVNLTKAKWYKQKGTGRARHGAKSAPIFVGGGVAHGPKGVKRSLALPRKMKQKALTSALSLKVKQKAVAAVGDLSAVKKTKDAKALIDLIRTGEKANKGRLTLVVSGKNGGVYRYFKNIADVGVERYSDLNAYKVYFGGRLIIDAEN